MRAAVLRAPGDVVLEERPVPRPGPGEVLVQVRAVGVCGSDTHYYERGRIGRFVVEAPLVLGHEAAGEVTELGGAFAEYVVVHEAFAHPVPGCMGDDAAALLEPLSVGIWACMKGRVTAGSRVLITGAGPIGLVSVAAALAFGATEVVVSDVNPVRLALAKELGATTVIDARATSVTDLYRPPEVLLECSGHPPAIGEAIRALDRAGRAVLVGMGGDEILLPLAVIQERELELTGTFRYAGTWPRASALIASGRINLDRLVTGTYRLDQAEQALTAGRRDQQSVKVMVHPQT